MKTDRELLELAARAAEINALNYCEEGMQLLVVGKPKYWNPLTDDGDALRLAVKLQIVAGKYDDYASAGVIGSCVEFVVWSHEEPDACAATRRAITRAAAAIGESM